VTFGVLDMTTRDGQPIRKGRISPALRSAIILIVHEALTVAEAAKRTGYQTESLAKALLKPHVRHERERVKRAWMASQTEKAWHTVADLATNAASEDVRLKASRTFLDAAGELTPDAKGQAGPSQLIQIITRAVDIAGQPLDQRLPGVIEAPSYKVVDAKPSDSGEV
jgi:hypothetical protein